MSNAKSKQAKPKSGLVRCMELASDRKGLVFLAAVLSSLAAIASFIPYIAVYFMTVSYTHLLLSESGEYDGTIEVDGTSTYIGVWGDQAEGTVSIEIE